MKITTPIYNMSVDYEPKCGEYSNTVYSKIATEILEDAILQWKELQQQIKEVYSMTADMKGARKELISFFRSAWCELILSVVAPNISYEYLLEKLEVPKLEVKRNVRRRTAH